MNHIYISYSKLIEGKKHYFVKKFLRLTGCENVSDILEGYGMHTDFNKACIIAGIKEHETRRRIFESMSENEPLAKLINLNNSPALRRSVMG